MTIYTTNEWHCYGKQNYGWKEYRLEGGKIVRYKCNRHKTFDKRENLWCKTEHAETFWMIGDPSVPEWLKKHIPKEK